MIGANPTPFITHPAMAMRHNLAFSRLASRGLWVKRPTLLWSLYSSSYCVPIIIIVVLNSIFWNELLISISRFASACLFFNGMEEWGRFPLPMCVVDAAAVWIIFFFSEDFFRIKSDDCVNFTFILTPKEKIKSLVSRLFRTVKLRVVGKASDFPLISKTSLNRQWFTIAPF